ncbi:MAG TPA: DNA mismatch repair protein MutS, partial [Armatimonadota bacterium]|nr:DNA mismatch repair protein MutS [Armatimonadota bacterium]
MAPDPGEAEELNGEPSKPVPASDARTEYTRRLEQHRADAARHERDERRIADGRLAVFAAGILMVLLVLGTRLLAPAWLVVPFCAYVALVILHDRTTRRRAAAERIVRFYEGGLARLDGAWAGRGVTGDRFQDPLHPYADDLDLFGRGSLFELLCLARTRAGEETLASWLRAPADAAVV